MKIKKHKANDILNDTITNGHGNTEFCLWSDVETIVEAAEALIEDVEDPDHEAHDWSQQVCVRDLKAALTPQKEAKE